MGITKPVRIGNFFPSNFQDSGSPGLRSASGKRHKNGNFWKMREKPKKKKATRLLSKKRKLLWGHQMKGSVSLQWLIWRWRCWQCVWPPVDPSCLAWSLVKAPISAPGWCVSLHLKVASRPHCLPQGELGSSLDTPRALSFLEPLPTSHSC